MIVEALLTALLLISVVISGAALLSSPYRPLRDGCQHRTMRQPHDRDQACSRHEIRIVEPRSHDRAGMRQSHLRDALP